MWVIPLWDLPTWMTPAPLRSILPGLEWLLREEIITVFKTSVSFLSCFTLILVIRIMNSSQNSMPRSHKMSPTLFKRHIRSILLSFPPTGWTLYMYTKDVLFQGISGHYALEVSITFVRMYS